MRVPSRAGGPAVAVPLVGSVVLVLATTSTGVTASQYGYTVTLSTNATLEGVAAVLPLPAGPVVPSPLAEAAVAGRLRSPGGRWVAVVETGGRPAVRLTAERVTAEARPDGRTYSSYAFGGSVPADHVVNTRDPLGHEPTLARPGATRDIPCPTVVPPADGTCHAFERPVFVRFDAPPGAVVDV